MATAQSGIFSLGEASHVHLQMDLAPGATFAAMAREAASAGIDNSPVSAVNIVVGFAYEHLAASGGSMAPNGARSFTSIAGPDGFVIPACQHDLWIWIAAANRDSTFDAARRVVNKMTGLAFVADERVGFCYRDICDLTGFIDGTENPVAGEAHEVVIVRNGSPGEDSSVALVQVWSHDLNRFSQLSVAAKEKVIGRTLPDSIELDEIEKMPSSHISRVVIEEAGEELEILRRSVPYGDSRENGLVFVGFSADQSRLDKMLKKMVGLGDGIRDELTKYSTPLSSAYYVVPSIEGLVSLAS